MSSRPSNSARSTTPGKIKLGPIEIIHLVFGFFGAFAISAFLSHVVQLDWRGAISALFSQWEHVRAAVRWALDLLLALPFRWLFDWNFEMPLVIADYLSVGLMFYASATRAPTPPGPRSHSPWVQLVQPGGLKAVRDDALLWPITVPLKIISAFSRQMFGVTITGSRLWYVFALSPIIFFCLLVSVNYLLL